MTLEQCASRMTALLARKPRKLATRKLLATLPKRDAITVHASDYLAVISRSVAKAEGRIAERDAQRYAAWEARGKPPSPAEPVRKDRVRPRAHIEGRSRLTATLVVVQSGCCGICGGEITLDDLDYDRRPNLDHVFPRARGGRDAANLIAVHRSCNSLKGARLPTGCELIWLEVVNTRLTSLSGAK